MDNTFPDSLLKLWRNAPDGSACLRAGAEFVKDHLDIPGTLSIFKVGRVGDGHLGLPMKDLEYCEKTENHGK